VTILLVVLLTAIPVATCGYVGSRLGGRRLARSVGGFVLASACGAALGFAALRFGWSRPFGLLTPAVAALLATGATWFAVLRWLPTDRDHTASRNERLFGAGLGAVCGVMLAGSLWIVATLGEGVAGSAEAPGAPVPTQAAASATPSWTLALVRTANRGFVRHLPVLGPLGDEMEATVAILNSSPEARRKLARGRHWERLTHLASYRDLANDAEFDRDLASVRNGNVLALYRLQRNPRVVAFMQEDEVHALLPELRPSALARELEELEQSPPR